MREASADVPGTTSTLFASPPAHQGSHQPAIAGLHRIDRDLRALRDPGKLQPVVASGIGLGLQSLGIGAALSIPITAGVDESHIAAGMATRTRTSARGRPPRLSRDRGGSRPRRRGLLGLGGRLLVCPGSAAKATTSGTATSPATSVALRALRRFVRLRVNMRILLDDEPVE